MSDINRNAATFDHWYPNDRDITCRIEPGAIIAWNFKPHTLIRKDSAVQDGLTNYVLRPIGIDPTVTAHDADFVLRGHDFHLHAINPHYGLCVHCNELLPCRSRMAEREAHRVTRRMKRYDTEGICPNCEEPVTHRQKSETFANIVVPLGPPVTYHAGRRACRHAMAHYRKQLGITDPQLRHDNECTSGK